MKSSAVLSSAFIRTCGKYVLLAAMVAGVFATPHLTSAQSVVVLQALSSAKLATRKLLSNWGVDSFWNPVVMNPNTIGFCTTSVSPNSLNSISYRDDSTGPKVRVIDNVASAGVPHITNVSFGGQVFTAASDQGTNFAFYSAMTDTLKYTVDSGVSWVTIPLVIPGVTDEINHHGQMLFGPDGVLYVFYFSAPPIGGTFNVLKVIPSASAPYYTIQNQVINSTSGTACSYSTCWAYATKTHTHVIVAFGPGRDTWQGYAPWGGPTPWQWQLPSYYTINTTNGQTHLGSIGEDPTWGGYCNPECQNTNEERMMLASDGTKVFVVRRTGEHITSYGIRADYGISDIGTIDSNGALVDNNNFPVQLNPNGATDPLTNLAAIPATELGGYMGELSPGKDPIRYFAAPMRPANFSGARSADVIFWNKDSVGWYNDHTFRKYRITNPNNAPGVIYGAPLEDVTENQLPPGYVNHIADHVGGAFSLSSVMNATVANFCIAQVNGSWNAYNITDAK